jgi:hypothetical protein
VYFELLAQVSFCLHGVFIQLSGSFSRIAKDSVLPLYLRTARHGVYKVYPEPFFHYATRHLDLTELISVIMKTKNLPTAALIGALLAIALPVAVAPARAQGVENPPTRTIRIATKEVTDPDVAVSSDGRWLVFTALGHLVQLPAAGGATKQLTSGPFYDSAPAISPDGTRVAFISDRKVSSQGNVFVLDIASGQIRQVTDEFWVDRPVWSPDGKSLAFLSYQRIGPVSNYRFVGPGLLEPGAPGRAR